MDQQGLENDPRCYARLHFALAVYGPVASQRDLFRESLYFEFLLHLVRGELQMRHPLSEIVVSVMEPFTLILSMWVLLLHIHIINVELNHAGDVWPIVCRRIAVDFSEGLLP